MTIRQSVNRRKAQRYSAGFVVSVYHQGGHVGDYEARDVGRGGLCLKPGRVMFWPGVSLQIRLHWPNRKRAGERRLAVVVRHCTARGMGLGFRARTVPRAMPREVGPGRTGPG